MTKYSRDSDPKRPLPLQEKIGRVVQALANSSFPKDPGTQENGLEVSEEAVRGVIWAWRERAYYLPGELLSDPAWGMLLELLLAEIGGRQVHLSRLYKSSAAPTTTAVRWLKAMEDRELVLRRADPDDAGNEFVGLTPQGSQALRRYFRDVVRQK